ncbi:MAG: hypothetical protein NZV14_16150 [Bryobacteraceae bacterium]|nr:hypothetical protein [Bryobacteraceae bacterium]MDW8379694.1 hypothetical protein [Bryobacterales bacterium]
MALRNWLCWLLVVLVGLDLSVVRGLAQEAPAPKKLNLVIVEGDGAVNNIRQRVAREPIVEVRDENDRPLAGVVVVFTLPNQGAGASFPNGARMLTTVTDNAGRAVGRGLQPNNVAGRFEIRVTASFRGQSASATITQENALLAATGASAAGSGKLIAILAAVGGAAAAGVAVAASRGGGGAAPTPAPTVTVISPGTPTVGPPR